jgi:hypothetical protein
VHKYEYSDELSQSSNLKWTIDEGRSILCHQAVPSRSTPTFNAPNRSIIVIFLNMLSIWVLVASAVLAIFFSYIFAYFSQHRSLREIPAPSPLAACSKFWLLYQARRGRRSLKVHEAHERLGTLVRLQPNHVSIASIEAIPIIYGHGSGFLKRWAYPLAYFQPVISNWMLKQNERTKGDNFWTPSVYSFESFK